MGAAMNQVDIKGRGGVFTSIHVDGHQLLAKTARLDLDARDIPVLVVTLPVINADINADINAGIEARVILDQPTHDALIAMGWTPPEGDA